MVARAVVEQAAVALAAMVARAEPQAPVQADPELGQVVLAAVLQAERRVLAAPVVAEQQAQDVAPVAPRPTT